MVTQDPTVPTVITQGLTVLTVVTQGPPAPTGHSGPTVLTVGPAWLRAGPQAGLCWERRQWCHRSPRSCLCLSWGAGSVSLLTIRFGFEVSQPQPHTGPLLVHSVWGEMDMLITDIRRSPPALCLGSSWGLQLRGAAFLPPGPGLPRGMCRPRVHRSEVSDLPVESSSQRETQHFPLSVYAVIFFFKKCSDSLFSKNGCGRITSNMVFKYIFILQK